VMELVPGSTLSGPLPVREALAVLRRSPGMEAAHEKGIVHRDLKPANVRSHRTVVSSCSTSGWRRLSWPDPEHRRVTMIPPDGVYPAGRAAWNRGVYESEQVRGLPVDRRTDIWAFRVRSTNC
jgi:serine/threonine-protein kinase